MLTQRVSSFQLIVIVSTLLFGCGQVDPKRGESAVLRELAAAHSWLVPEGSDPATHYRPWRRSWCENSGVEMTLFIPPDSIDEGHRVVLFKNSGSDKPLGVVLPSNASTDYWNFEFDHAKGPLRDSTRFEAELIRVARSLGKADRPNDFRAFVFDFFRGSLLLDMTQAGDSAIQWTITATEGLGNDGDTLSWARHDSIMVALTDTLYGIGIPPRPIAFLDVDADRVFLFEPNDLFGRTPPKGRVHVFRLGQNVIPLDL